ncbi:unnamed protein product [Victoria cruziana]
MLKSEDEAWLLYDTLAENSLHNTGPTLLRHQTGTVTSIPGRKGTSETGSGSHTDEKLDALSRKLDQLLSSKTTGYGQPVCALCDSSGHITDECPLRRAEPAQGQAVNAAQGFSRPYDPYSATYNPGWRNHPNFGWRNTGYQQQQQYQPQPQYYQQQYSQQQQPQLPAPPVRPQLEYPQRPQIEYPQAQRQIVTYPQEQRQMMLQRMEQQMGKMAELLGQRRVEGSLLSQPLGNPKGKGLVLMIEGSPSVEQYDVGALRSSREYQPTPQEQFQPPPVQYQPPPPPTQPAQPTTTTSTSSDYGGANTGPYTSSPSS